MGILNVTPDSFSGDGLLAGARDGADEPDPVEAAVAAALAMVADGADLLDIGGESTRPGHAAVAADAEIDRVVPVVAAVRRPCRTSRSASTRPSRRSPPRPSTPART